MKDISLTARSTLARWIAYGIFFTASQAHAQTVPNTPASDKASLPATVAVPDDVDVRERALRRHSGDISPANEQGDAQRPPPPGLAGDWFGLKKRLSDAGVGLTSRYVSESAWNPVGGQREKITETGQLDLGLHLDMKQIAGIDGHFQATVTYRRGDDLGQVAGLGTLQQVQEVYGRGQAWRLTQLWYGTTLLHGTVDLKLGSTSPGEDFAAFSCSFQNLSFCGSQPGNLVGNYWYNWPVSQWGGRLRVNHGAFYAQIAAYAENPRNLDNSFTPGHISGTTGALIPLELGFVRGGQNGSPVGAYKLGGWISTASAPDLVLDIHNRPMMLSDLPPLEHSSAHGVWVNAQQQLTGRSKEGKTISGLTVFVNATFADRATALTDNQIAIGLFEKGLFTWFTEDVLGLGVARTHVNGRMAAVQQLVGQPPQGSEYATELYYGFHPRSWLELRPNLQWVHHAGGYGKAPEVGVVGMKMALTL